MGLLELLRDYQSEWPFVDGSLLLEQDYVIVPDVHGRVDMVQEVFRQYPSTPIIFLGDILHSENRERWTAQLPQTQRLVPTRTAPVLHMD